MALPPSSSGRPLADNEVRVPYEQVESLDPDSYRAALTWLADDERSRLARFAMQGDRDRFVAARALLRRTLSAVAPVDPEAWQFVVDASGKPRLGSSHAGLDLSFNLSHTAGLVACAVARRDVGVDVEGLDRNVRPMEIASRFFSRPEIDWLERAPVDQRPVEFLSLWTLKEAYVKAIGAGLSHPLATWGFTFEDGGVRFHAPPGVDAARWHFELFAPTPRHRLAVAVRVDTDACPTVSVYGVSAGRPIGPIFSTRQARPARRVRS